MSIGRRPACENARIEFPATPPLPSSRPVRARWAITVSAAAVALAVLALVYPFPSGPADSGDFIRVFTAFSSGPEGLPAFVDRSDPGTFAQRYFHFYLRYWHLGHGVRRFARPSSALACYIPGILLRFHRGDFDLAANAVALVLLLGAGLYAVLRQLPAVAFVALGACALVATDANIVGYLNSFYQESGALVAVAGLTGSLFLLWRRRRGRDAALVAAFSAMLATAKPAYALAIFAGLPVVLGATLAGDGRHLPRAAAGAGAAAAALVVLIVFSWTSHHWVADHAYHFVFTAALPRLPPAERGGFLQEIGIDPRFASLSGKNPYAPGNPWREPALALRLTQETHARALARIIRKHPGTFVAILGESFAVSGRYPRLAFPAIGASPPRGGRWTPWSRFRLRRLAGKRAYAAWLVLLAALGVRWRSAAPGGWERFFALLSLGYGAASVLQIVISVLGEGFADIAKHDFLGNVLLDFALVAALAGVAETLGRRRSSMPATPSPAS